MVPSTGPSGGYTRPSPYAPTATANMAAPVTIYFRLLDWFDSIVVTSHPLAVKPIRTVAHRPTRRNQAVMINFCLTRVNEGLAKSLENLSRVECNQAAWPTPPSLAGAPLAVLPPQGPDNEQEGGKPNQVK